MESSVSNSQAYAARIVRDRPLARALAALPTVSLDPDSAAANLSASIAMLSDDFPPMPASLLKLPEGAAYPALSTDSQTDISVPSFELSKPPLTGQINVDPHFSTAAINSKSSVRDVLPIYEFAQSAIQSSVPQPPPRLPSILTSPLSLPDQSAQPSGTLSLDNVAVQNLYQTRISRTPQRHQQTSSQPVRTVESPLTLHPARSDSFSRAADDAEQAIKRATAALSTLERRDARAFPRAFQLRTAPLKQTDSKNVASMPVGIDSVVAAANSADGRGALSGGLGTRANVGLSSAAWLLSEDAASAVASARRVLSSITAAKQPVSNVDYSAQKLIDVANQQISEIKLSSKSPESPPPIALQTIDIEPMSDSNQTSFSFSQSNAQTPDSMSAKLRFPPTKLTPSSHGRRAASPSNESSSALRSAALSSIDRLRSSASKTPKLSKPLPHVDDKSTPLIKQALSKVMSARKTSLSSDPEIEKSKNAVRALLETGSVRQADLSFQDSNLISAEEDAVSDQRPSTDALSLNAAPQSLPNSEELHSDSSITSFNIQTTLPSLVTIPEHTVEASKPRDTVQSPEHARFVERMSNIMSSVNSADVFVKPVSTELLQSPAIQAASEKIAERGGAIPTVLAEATAVNDLLPQRPAPIPPVARVDKPETGYLSSRIGHKQKELSSWITQQAKSFGFASLESETYALDTDFWSAEQEKATHSTVPLTADSAVSWSPDIIARRADIRNSMRSRVITPSFAMPDKQYGLSAAVKANMELFQTEVELQDQMLQELYMGLVNPAEIQHVASTTSSDVHVLYRSVMNQRFASRWSALGLTESYVSLTEPSSVSSQSQPHSTNQNPSNSVSADSAQIKQSAVNAKSGYGGTSYMDTLLRNVNPNARSLPTNVDAVQSILASPLTTTDTASRQHASHPWPSDSSTSFPTPSDLVAREADLREIGSIADEPWPVGDPRWESSLIRALSFRSFDQEKPSQSDATRYLQLQQFKGEPFYDACVRYFDAAINAMRGDLSSFKPSKPLCLSQGHRIVGLWRVYCANALRAALSVGAYSTDWSVLLFAGTPDHLQRVCDSGFPANLNSATHESSSNEASHGFDFQASLHASERAFLMHCQERGRRPATGRQYRWRVVMCLVRLGQTLTLSPEQARSFRFSSQPSVDSVCVRVPPELRVSTFDSSPNFDYVDNFRVRRGADCAPIAMLEYEFTLHKTD